ncbi:MAG: hypothetical protein R3D00_10680 [Bacteroidia bacterium]
MNQHKIILILIAMFVWAGCLKQDFNKQAGEGLYTGNMYRTLQSLNPQSGLTTWDTTYTETIEVVTTTDSIWFVVGDNPPLGFILEDDKSYENAYGSGNGRSFHLTGKDSLIYNEGTYYGNGTTQYEQTSASFQGKRK